MKYGALESIPRLTTINGQPHMLAYINPEEEGLIQEYRENTPPIVGPSGVPAYFFHSSWGGGSKSTASTSSNDDDDDGPGFFESLGNAITSVGSAISNTVSSAVDYVSDAGSAAVETISNVASNVGSVASDVVTEVVTLGAADTQTFNPDETQDAIDQTIAANPGSSFNDGVITSSSGETLSVGTNVSDETFTNETNVSDETSTTSSVGSFLTQGQLDSENSAIHSANALSIINNSGAASNYQGFTTDNPLFYDVNNDGQVTLTDALMIQEGALPEVSTDNEQDSLLDQATDFVTGAGQAALDTLTEIVTLGGADTQTYNTTENNATENNNTVLESVANFLTPNDGQTYVDSVLMPTSDAINATLAANEGSSYDGDTNTITGADGSTIGIGTNVDADDVTDALYSELLPGGSGGSTDLDDFQALYEAQSAAAELDPTGGSTATGFLVDEGFTADLDGDGVAENYTSDTEYSLNPDGSIVVADSEDDTTGGLSLLGQDMIDLGLADSLGEGEFADGSGMTDLTQLGGGDSDGIVGGGGLDEIFTGDGVAEEDSYFIDDDSQPYSTDIYGSRDIMGDFYGGKSGGMWSRFANSYLTRFGYSPEEFNEMIRKVENPDGTTRFFGADGALINPESIGSNYKLYGDPVSLKIGEEQVAIGSQNYDAQGNLISTSYLDTYNPDLDAEILAQNQVYSVTDPASGQLVTFPNQAQYDQFVEVNNAALAS
jgi:hypothetical protein